MPTEMNGAMMTNIDIRLRRLVGMTFPDGSAAHDEERSVADDVSLSVLWFEGAWWWSIIVYGDDGNEIWKVEVVASAELALAAAEAVAADA